MLKGKTEFYEVAWKKRKGEVPDPKDPSFKLSCATLPTADRFAGILKKDLQLYSITIIIKQSTKIL